MTKSDRRAARSQMPVRKYRLGEEPVADASVILTPAERFALVQTLTARLLEFHPEWPREVPYTRATMPIVVRRGP